MAIVTDELQVNFRLGNGLWKGWW